jgi:hypothetical protein
VSVGVKVAVRVCAPGLNTVPAAGEYVNVPGTFAVAFNCVAPRADPYVMGVGVGQVITGTSLTVTEILAVSNSPPDEPWI